MCKVNSLWEFFATGINEIKHLREIKSLCLEQITEQKISLKIAHKVIHRISSVDKCTG
jgi:hypothetical protein